MTLKFFGEVDSERLDVIAEALRFAAAGAGPLSLRLGDLGAFPSRSRPRILWVGVRGAAVAGAAAGPDRARLRGHRLSAGGRAVPAPRHPRPSARGPAASAPGVGRSRRRIRAGAVPGPRAGLYESLLTTGGPALRVAPHPRSGPLMGCLTAPFRLLGYLGRDCPALRSAGFTATGWRARPARCSAASAAGPLPPRAGPGSKALLSAHAKIDSLNGWRADSVVLVRVGGGVAHRYWTRRPVFGASSTRSGWSWGRITRVSANLATARLPAGAGGTAGPGAQG